MAKELGGGSAGKQKSPGPRAPKIRPGLEIWPGPCQESGLRDRQDFFANHLSVSHWTGLHASHLSFFEVILEKVQMDGTDFPHVRFDDTSFVDCNLANSIWDEASFQRVALAGCRMVGLRCNDSSGEDIHFKDCNLQLCQFRFAKLKRAKFEDCNLTGADFFSAELDGAIFENCQLEGTDLSNCKLKGADIHSCEINGLRIQTPSLAGLRVSREQAIQLAAMTGLTVVPD